MLGNVSAITIARGEGRGSWRRCGWRRPCRGPLLLCIKYYFAVAGHSFGRSFPWKASSKIKDWPDGRIIIKKGRILKARLNRDKDGGGVGKRALGWYLDQLPPPSLVSLFQLLLSYSPDSLTRDAPHHPVIGPLLIFDPRSSRNAANFYTVTREENCCKIIISINKYYKQLWSFVMYKNCLQNTCSSYKFPFVYQSSNPILSTSPSN